MSFKFLQATGVIPPECVMHGAAFARPGVRADSAGPLTPLRGRRACACVSAQRPVGGQGRRCGLGGIVGREGSMNTLRLAKA